MTDQPQAVQPDWLPRLREVIRGSAHETRNALNGLVVNLEVVRSRLARAADGSPEILPFAEQAMGQAEESVKLNEAVGSLLLLISGAVDSNGLLHCAQAPASRRDCASKLTERPPTGYFPASGPWARH